MKRPEPTSRHPLIYFLMVLCVMSGLRIVLGASAPGSVEAGLFSWQVKLWGAGLGGGATMFLIGVALQPHDGAPKVRTGIVLEQLGCAFLCAACTVYAACILEATRSEGLFPAGVILVFALASGLRWRSIQRHVNALNTPGVVADGAR